MQVRFLGYKSKPTRGQPALTVGKIYETINSKVFSNPRYICVRNDRDVSMSYPKSNFEEVQIEKEINA